MHILPQCFQKACSTAMQLPRCILLHWNPKSVFYYREATKLFSTTMNRGYILLSYGRLDVFYHNATSCLHYTTAKSYTYYLLWRYQKLSSITLLITYMSRYREIRICIPYTTLWSTCVYSTTVKSRKCALLLWSQLPVFHHGEIAYVYSTTVKLHMCILLWQNHIHASQS